MPPASSRPEAMNVTTNHPKVKVNARLSDAFFIAGSTISGKMDLECKADKGLALGMVQVELYAIEELTSRDHSARSNFMHAVRLFQGQGLPPSNAVLPHPLPGEPPLPPNYWQARRGQTSFLFKFDLPSRAPGTMDFGRGLARVRYEVRATAAVAWKGERRLVTNVKEAVVVEDIEDAELKAEAIVVGENGKIWIQGRVIGGVLVAGHSACLELQVKNHSTKKNTGLVVTLGRHLHLPNVAPGDKQPLQISDTLTSVDFKGAEYIVGPGVEGVANLVFDVPKNAAGVRGGQREGEDGEGRMSSPLFEVRCIVSCRMTMGIGSKDIQLEIPVRIVHEVVLPPPPVPEEYAPGEYPIPAAVLPYVPTGQSMPPYAQDPRATSPYPYDPRPVSPYAYVPNGSMVPPHPSLSPRPTSPYMSPRPSSPYMYQQPPIPIMPPMQPFVDSSRVWIPPPIVPYQYYTPPMPGLAHSPPSMNHIPPRSPSTQPPMASYLQHVPTGLPANAAGQQPLLAALAAVSERPEDEGKGERAARISHHLRATSRHRSVSPPANRSMDDEPVLPTSPGLVATSPPDGGGLTLSPNSHDRPRRMSLDDRASGSPIHSPRPLLSPKASFTRETVAQGGSMKSTNVVALEELAGAADKLHADMSSDLPVSALVDAAALVALDHNKTLPGPPVPSGKASANLASRPRAEDIFVLEPPTPASVTRAPPTPTLVAFSPGRHQRASPAAIDSLAAPGGESGLDALERRLLAQVGTRKVEKESRPDVRNVLSIETEPPAVSTPIAIPPRKSSGQDTPMGDSAISSLTLSNGRSVDERPQLLSMNPMVDLGVGLTLGQRLSLENVKSAEVSPRRTPSPPGTPRSPIEEEPRGSKERRKSGSARGSGGPTKEVVQLRKAAKGRIAAWLETVTPDVPPQVDSIASSPEPTPPPATAAFDLKEEDLDSSDDGKTNKARSRVPSPVPALPKVASKVNGDLGEPTSKHSQPTAAVAEVNVAPNPRSSGFVPIGSIKPKFTSGTPTITKSPRLPVFPTTSGLAAPEVKYDVRSARGGRGGKVTAVAALWANQKQDDKKPSGVNIAPIFKPAVTRSPSTPSMKQQAAARAPAPTPPTRTKDAVKLSASTPTSDTTVSPPKWSDVAKKPPVPRLARPTPFADVAKVRPAPPVSSPTAARSNMGDLTANRARMIKSPTVPAMVSSSHATPTISSTASLVHPTSMSATSIALPGLAKNRLPTPLSPRKEIPPTISTGPPKTGTPVVSHKLRDELRNIASSPPPVKAASPEPAGGGVGQTRLRELIKKYQGQAK